MNLSDAVAHSRSSFAASVTTPRIALETPFGSSPIGPALSWSEGLSYFVIALVLDIVIGLRTFPSVLQGSLVNPDTYMRLVRLRESIAEQTLVHVVSRDSSGAGTLLHWSHLLDGSLLLLAAPLRLVMSNDAALHGAALAFGPIAFGLLSCALVWAMAPFSERKWRWLAPLLAALSPGIIGFAVPGEVHHHIPVAAASVMVAGWALRAPTRTAAGRAMGAWAGIAIWLTPESMPFILASFGGLGLFWLLRPDELGPGRALRGAGATFLAVTAIALAIDPPFAGYAAVQIERLSIVYLVLAAVVCGVGWAVAQLDRLGLPPTKRGAAAALAAVTGLGIWFALFPAELAGPYRLLNADQTQLFFGVISDMQPIESLSQLTGYLLDGALAVAAGAIIAARSRSPVWAFAVLCAALTIVLGYAHRRFATYPEIVAAAMLPVIISALGVRSTAGGGNAVAFARLAVASLFLLLPQFGGLFAPKTAAATGGAGCDPRSLERALQPYAGQIVLSDPGDTPALLYWTNVRTVGSLFHLQINAFLRLRAAWRSGPSDRVPDAVRATGASLIVICRQPNRSLLVSDLPAVTLFDRLNTGDPPPWLVPLGSDGAPGYQLYRITDAPR